MSPRRPATAPRWYQLYWPKDRELAVSFLERAAAAGYRALVVTLDTYTMGWRPRDLDGAFLPFLKGVGNQNYFADPVFQRTLGGVVDDERLGPAVLHWAATFGDPTLTWDDLAFLREHWHGPIALKGIQHPDDARRAADAGIDAVIVSNHGGRQVDGAIASLDALPGVVEAVGDRVEVLFDSGIRTGADVVKPLALGARAVLLGRPYVYGLGLGGEAGVRHVLRCVLAELELTLALTGVRGQASSARSCSFDVSVRAEACPHCGSQVAVASCRDCGREFALTIAHEEGRLREFDDAPLDPRGAPTAPPLCDFCDARPARTPPTSRRECRHAAANLPELPHDFLST